ncbi:MAG: glycerol-3-phosphate dehydrogenase, partial [Clostridia bacterium]|nr:glycerol-3-phosphate dehydrogenase [Clostridia bacterium]
MNITVIGCGRWGSCIAWYLDKINHKVKLYGKIDSPHMQKLLSERKNEYIKIPE